MKDIDGENSCNLNEDINIEDKESELDREQSQATECLTQNRLTGSEEQDMFGPEMEKSTSNCNDPLFAGLVEDKLIELLQVGHYAAKKSAKALLFNLVGEVIIEIFQQGKLDSLLVSNVEALIQPDRFVEALSRHVLGCQSLFTPLTEHAKHRINRIQEEHHLVQRLH